MYNLYLIPALMDITKNYIYYLIDKKTGTSAIIDPGDAKPIKDFIAKNSFIPNFILNTHHHWDHTDGNLELKSFFNLKIVANEKDRHQIPGADTFVKYGDKFCLGDIEFEIIHTPGHTNNHIAFYSQNAKLLFCGDTMFSGGCGRLFEGTPSDLLISFKKFYALPDDTRVCCAHEYTLSNLEYALQIEPNNLDIKSRIEECKSLLEKVDPTIPSTIEIEKQTNPYMRFRNSEFRKAIGLNEQSTDSEVYSRLFRQ